MIDDKQLDLLGATQLIPLIEDGSYLPFTNSSLRYASIAVLLNDIIINNRRFIIELGSGLTTLLIGKLAKKNNLKKLRLLSIDENDFWVESMKILAINLGITDYVSFLHAPLVECNLAKNNLKWYDVDLIRQELIGANMPIDSILVDGPSAWYPEIDMARFPALPFFVDYMGESSIIFLDDTNREGEKKIIESWREIGLTETRYNQSFTSFSKGKMFNISI